MDAFIERCIREDDKYFPGWWRTHNIHHSKVKINIHENLKAINIHSDDFNCYLQLSESESMLIVNVTRHWIENELTEEEIAAFVLHRLNKEVVQLDK